MLLWVARCLRCSYIPVLLLGPSIFASIQYNVTIEARNAKPPFGVLKIWMVKKTRRSRCHCDTSLHRRSAGATSFTWPLCQSSIDRPSLPWVATICQYSIRTPAAQETSEKHKLDTITTPCGGQLIDTSQPGVAPSLHDCNHAHLKQESAYTTTCDCFLDKLGRFYLNSLPPSFQTRSCSYPHSLKL